MKNKGFTLIELMVVIVIIGIPTAIVVPKVVTAKTLLRLKSDGIEMTSQQLSKFRSELYIKNGNTPITQEELIQYIKTVKRKSFELPMPSMPSMPSTSTEDLLMKSTTNVDNPTTHNLQLYYAWKKVYESDITFEQWKMLKDENMLPKNK